MKAVFDTNILIDYLNGIAEAARELSRYRDKLISIITWMEVLAGARDADQERFLRRFLKAFKVIHLDYAVAEEAIGIRKEQRVKLPDAIIYATARRNGCLLVTRNSKDFDPAFPDVRLPYTL
ncbi:type II toxin-antitoxin system VapC family toxin [soil metagenome]|nr:type II toxin-antitoxin system VapC family toxin [Deinococcota bacterium]